MRNESTIPRRALARRREAPAGVRRGYASRRCGGQILVIALLAITVLVGLVVYVYNTGSVLNRRVSLQTTADSAAVSGATWMARSMNVVAMNNVGQSRSLALVPILDALPLATEMSYEEIRDWEDRLDDQLRRPVPNEYRQARMMRTGMESLRARMAAQRDILAAAHSRLDPDENGGAFEMEETTHWAVRGYGGSPPHGSLWQTAVALEDMSLATIESAGLLAQADAVRFGRANAAEACFVAPVAPRLPAREGEFEDFQPVLQGVTRVRSTEAHFQDEGGPGGAIPDAEYPHRLGPWARLLRHDPIGDDPWPEGWRIADRRATAWRWVPATAGTGQTRGGGGAIGGRTVGGSARTGHSGGGHGGYRVATDYETIGYHTYGPYVWMFHHVDWWANDHEWRTPSGWTFHAGELPDTLFYRYLRNISDIKLGYMFGPQEPKLVHYPQWVVHYPDAKNLAERPNVRVTQTMFYVVEIASSVPANSAGWLRDGTYRTNGEYPIALWANGWVDPDANPRLTKVVDYIWRDEYTYETTLDEEIGISLTTDADGEPEWHRVYMYAWYIFGGIDVGGEIEVSNPCNWEESDRRPVPFLLDTGEGDYPDAVDADGYPSADVGVRRRRFSFLGVARRGAGAPVWSGRFATINPDDSMLAVAQAKLFNKASWDLWTQDWQVQLTPVSGWEEWTVDLIDGVDQADLTEGLVDPYDVDAAATWFEALGADMAAEYMTH